MTKYNFFDQEDYAAFVNNQIDDLMREQNGSVEDLEKEARQIEIDRLRAELKM